MSALDPGAVFRLPLRVFALLRRHPALLPSVASVGYVAVVAALRQGVGWRAFLHILVALGLAVAAATSARRTLAFALWGAGVTIAASLGTPLASFGLTLASCLGGLVATLAARAALARVPGFGGMVLPRPHSLSVGLAALAVPWVVAAVAAALRGSQVPAVVVGGALASYALLVGIVLKHRLERRLELGVVERLGALSQSGIALLLLGGATALVSGVPGAAVAVLLPALFGVLVAALATGGDPVRIARVVRRIVALALFGGAIVLVAAFAAEERPWAAGVIVLVAVALALAAGSFIQEFEAPLLPAQGALLEGAARAESALLRLGGDDARSEALRALRVPAGPAAPSPELWTLEPVRVLTVDAAGYAHERAAELPTELVAVAKEEPHTTLRTAALVALEVRRPSLRPLARWLEDRGMLSATLVVREGEVEGLLVLPRGVRVEPLTLEEVRVLEALATRFGSACAARSALGRSLMREQEHARIAADAEARAERAEHQLDRQRAAHEGAAARLARPATVGIYSAASRMAYEALERSARAGAPLVVTARSGVDPVPFLARAHLAGARKEGPLVVVDGTATREHDLARWRDATASPLALAEGGVLLLVDGAVLPVDVQRLLGQALAERRPPWERAEPLDVVPWLTTVPEPQVLLDENRLDPVLAARFGAALEAPVRLPSISERPEDVRALLTDRLAREGLRVRGRPVGVDDAAFGLLVEHPFEGQDAELQALVQRLVAACGGDVVHVDDVRKVLGNTPKEAAPETQRKSRRPKSVT